MFNDSNNNGIIYVVAQEIREYFVIVILNKEYTVACDLNI